MISALLASDSWHVGIPRPAADVLLRYAWHLTSVAWWALAAILFGAPAVVAAGLMCVASGAILIVVAPGHLAWPLFFAAGVLALWGVDAMPPAVWWVLLGVAVLIALAAAGFHVAWALGSSVGATNVVPERPEHSAQGKLFIPGPVPTLGVALALITLSGLLVAAGLGASGGWLRALLIAALVVLSARVMGDGTWTGVLKRVRDTGFARADDRYWTPAVALLALGATAALALGATN